MSSQAKVGLRRWKDIVSPSQLDKETFIKTTFTVSDSLFWWVKNRMTLQKRGVTDIIEYPLDAGKKEMKDLDFHADYAAYKPN